MCPLNTLSFCCLNPHKALEVRAALLVSSLPPPFLLPTFCIKLFFFLMVGWVGTQDWGLISSLGF